MKTFLAVVALILAATLPVRADNNQPALTPRDALNVRNCVALIQIPINERKPELERGNNNYDLTHSNCIEVLSRRGTHEQANKIELPNRSNDTRLANCVRAFFAIAADGTEFDVEPDRNNCGTPATCTATITVLATDGLHTKTLDVSGGLMELNVHPTGRWLSLKYGEFSCSMPKKSADNLR